MIFSIFARACKKYGFSFSLSTHGQISIMLMPNNAFENIYINQDYFNRNFNKIFLRAIKEMRQYRAERSYQ